MSLVDVYPLDEISSAEFNFEKFSRSSGAHFFSFISAYLIVSAFNIPNYL